MDCEVVKEFYQTVTLSGGKTGCCASGGSFSTSSCVASKEQVDALVDYTPFWLDPRTLLYKDRDFSQNTQAFENVTWSEIVWAGAWGDDQMASRVAWIDLSNAELKTMSTAVGAAMSDDTAVAPFRDALQNKYVIVDAALDWSSLGFGVIDAERHYMFMSSLYGTDIWTGMLRFTSDHQQFLSGHRGAKMHMVKYKVGTFDGKRALYVFGLFEKPMLSRPITGEQDYFVSEEMGFDFVTYLIKGEGYVLPTKNGTVTPQVSGAATGMVLRFVLNDDDTFDGYNLGLDYWTEGIPGLPGMSDASEYAFAFDAYQPLGVAGMIKQKIHTTVHRQITGGIARELLGQ